MQPTVIQLAAVGQLVFQALTYSKEIQQIVT